MFQSRQQFATIDAVSYNSNENFVKTKIKVQSQAALVIGATSILIALMKMACSNTDETVTLMVMVQKSMG